MCWLGIVMKILLSPVKLVTLYKRPLLIYVLGGVTFQNVSYEDN
jgi:hypothetical protein